MQVVKVYARLYADCAKKTGQGLAKNAWTLLLPGLLGLVFSLVAPLVAPLGFIGGLLLTLAMDALISCYLYFLGEVVARSKVSLGELKTSVAAYFFPVMSVFFVWWVVTFLLGGALKGSPQGGVIYTGLWVVALVALNAAPEVLYTQGLRGGLDNLGRSLRFLQANWIEWFLFLPNLALVLYLVLGGFIGASRLAFLGGLGNEVFGFFAGALLHGVMVYRGHLFLALDGSSHRQRMFKYRNAA